VASKGFSTHEVDQFVQLALRSLESRGIAPGESTSADVAAAFAAERERVDAIVRSREASGGILDGPVRTEQDG
jgi:hypothetical protein